MNIGTYGPSGYADLQREARILALLGGGSYVPGCYLDFAIAGSALTVRLLSAHGQAPSPSNPIIAAFHDSTASVGKPVIRRVTHPLRLIIPSTATMGFTSATAAALWFVLFDDVTTQTQRLGVINCLSSKSIYPLGAWPIASSTATPASSAHVFYTDAAVTSMPYVVLGRASWESGLSTAGTWDALPTRVRMHGPGSRLPGEAFNAQHATPYTAATGLTTTTTLDDTTPLSTEGTEILSKAITPTSATSPVAIRIAGFGISIGSGGIVVVNIFRGATCICSYAVGVNGTYVNIGYDLVDSPATAASTTYKAYVSATGSGTVYLNGNNSTRLFGGVASCTMRLEEIQT